jgi:uncharacterized protein (TIGR03086 family)
MDEYLERYRRRADAFEAKVASVQPGQWANPSPCVAWTALDVVNHIVEMHDAMLRPLGAELTPGATVQSDPLTAFQSARADIEGRLESPELAAVECQTPSGPMSFGQHVDGVVSEDMVIHGWDLAKATEQDPTIDPVEVARLWPACQQIPAEVVAKLRTPGAFGPGVEVFGPEYPVMDDATDEQRLIAFFGRNPY